MGLEAAVPGSRSRHSPSWKKAVFKAASGPCSIGQTRPTTDSSSSERRDSVSLKLATRTPCSRPPSDESSGANCPLTKTISIAQGMLAEASSAAIGGLIGAELAGVQTASAIGRRLVYFQASALVVG